MKRLQETLKLAVPTETLDLMKGSTVGYIEKLRPSNNSNCGELTKEDTEFFEFIKSERVRLVLLGDQGPYQKTKEVKELIDLIETCKLLIILKKELDTLKKWSARVRLYQTTNKEDNSLLADGKDILHSTLSIRHQNHDSVDIKLCKNYIENSINHKTTKIKRLLDSAKYFTLN